ncbi:MAG: hypothetical protein ABSB88_17305 [Bryobacteraceae bacterium]
MKWETRHREQQLLYAAVTEYVRVGYNRAMREKRNYIGFLLLLLQRLVTSSTRAIRSTLERRLEALQQPDEQLSLFPQMLDEEWAELDGQEQIERLLKTRLKAMKNERAEVELLLETARRSEQAGPDAKAEALIDWIYQLRQQESEPVPIDPETDCALIDTGSPEEFSFFLEHLVSRGFLEKHGNGYRVTVAGWQRVETAGAASSGQPGRCFVAMAFDPALNDVYELGIQLAIKDCGFEPIRVDKVEHNEKICDRILAEIRRARFLVADFTLHRKGVYFEAGFATAIGMPVIFCCRSDELAQTHFDTRQYNHIVWETADDLRAKLSDRVRATIIEKD